MAEQAVAARPISRAELLLYGFCRIFAVGSTVAMFPGRPVGMENLPRSGAYILAPVHRSNIDWIVVARLSRRRFRYIVKAEVWKVGFVGRFIELLGAFPVHRENADRESLQRCIEVLQGGEPLILFPEGTRRSGPAVEDLREGAAYLALRAQVPIVPVGLAATERALPRGRRFPRPTHVTVVVGEPIIPVAPPGEEGSRGRVPRSATRELTEELRIAMERVLYDALALDRLRGGSGLASSAVATGERTEVDDDEGSGPERAGGE